MTTSKTSDQFETLVRRCHFTSEDPINTEIQRVREALFSPTKVALRTLQEISDVFSETSRRLHPQFVQRILELVAQKVPRIDATFQKVLSSAAEHTGMCEEYVTFVCLSRAQSTAKYIDKSHSEKNLITDFEEYWKNIKLLLEEKAYEYKTTQIDQGIQPELAESQCVEVVARAIEKIDMRMGNDLAALSSVQEMMDKSPHVRLIVKELLYYGQRQELVKLARLKDVMENECPPSQREALWRILLDDTSYRLLCWSDHMVPSICMLIVNHIKDYILINPNEFVRVFFKFSVLDQLQDQPNLPDDSRMASVKDFLETIPGWKTPPWDSATLEQNKEALQAYLPALRSLIRQIKNEGQKILSNCAEQASESYVSFLQRVYSASPFYIQNRIETLHPALLKEIKLGSLPNEILGELTMAYFLRKGFIQSREEQESSLDEVKKLSSALDAMGVQKPIAIEFIKELFSIIYDQGIYQNICISSDPLTLVNALSQDRLRELVEHWKENSPLCPDRFIRMIVFLKNGGTRALFVKTLGISLTNTIASPTVPARIVESILIDCLHPKYFENEEVIREFHSLSDDEFSQLSVLSPLFNRLGALGKKEAFLSLVRNKEKLSFLASLFQRRALGMLKGVDSDVTPSDRISHVISTIRKKYSAASRLFDCLKSPILSLRSVRKKDLQFFWDDLDQKDRLHLLSAFPTAPVHFYCAEEAGMFAQAALLTPLSSIPTEPLIRFLSSQPFPEIKAWLEESIQTSSGAKKRLKTLSEDQRDRILRRFHRYESTLPLLPWMNLFAITNQQARSICTSIEPSRMEVSHSIEIHSSDPVSLFMRFKSPDAVVTRQDIRRMILGLLSVANESTICGGRTYLTWRIGSESSPISAQDTTSLFYRLDGQIHASYTPCLFNDYTFASSAVSLKRMIDDAIKRGPYPDSRMSVHPMNRDEISLEIDRLAQHIEESYPQITGSSSEPPEKPLPSTLDPMTSERKLQDLHQIIQTFRQPTLEDLIRATYQTLVSHLFDITGDRHIEYDRDHSAHRNALIFMSLLLLFRSAKLQSAKDNIVKVSLSPEVSFRLKSLPPGKFEMRVEDNPGFDKEQLAMLTSEHPRHTISPITPTAFITPQMVQIFIDNIKSLDDQNFYFLCLFCLSRLKKTDDKYLDTAAYFTKLKAACPSGNLLGPEAATILIALAKEYVGSIDTMSGALAPNSKVAFDPHGLDTYFDQRRIPEFIGSEGNYASALCRSFDAHNPLLHDGNCAINSFLMGLLGADAYSDDPASMARLRADVEGFRRAIVAYAVGHRAGLTAKYPIREVRLRDEVTRLIDLYNDDTQSEWTSSIVWDIAAEVYGRAIRVYSRTGPTFSVDASCEIEPTAIFSPQREPTGAPIHLMFYGDVHYCLLTRRMTG